MKMKEKISVIGVGRLGLSFALLLNSKWYDVVGCDVNEKYIQSLNDKTFSSKEPGVNELLSTSGIEFTTDVRKSFDHSDILFVFVPTPSREDGAYNHKYVDQVISKLQATETRDKTLVVGCTVMPGYCESVKTSLSGSNINVVYNPEFIAQGSIISGLENADIVLIGGDAPEELLEVYRKIMVKEPNFKCLSLTGSEIAKISINCFLTLKIAFANYIGGIINNSWEKENMDSILDAIGSDSRIGKKCLGYGFPAGGPCVLPTQDIVTKRGLLQIKDVVVGDYVLSHDGKFNKVTELFKRPYNGVMYKFKMEGFSTDTLTITPEHPIYSCHRIGDREHCVKGKNRKRSMLKLDYEKIIPSFIEAKELHPGDFFCIPKITIKNKNLNANFSSSPFGKFPDKLEITPDMMRFFGYYLAEGSTWKKEVKLTFHKNETEFHDDVISIIANTFGLKPKKFIRGEASKSNTMIVLALSQRLAGFLRETFGSGAENKKIPYEWLHLSEEHIINLVRGLWYGDGSNSTGVFSYTSISKDLFTFCKLALNRLMIPFTTKIGKARVGADGVKHKTSYTIMVAKAIGMKAINKIIPLKAIDMGLSKRGDKLTTFWQNDVFYYRVRSRESMQYNGYVYNLEVDKANSYMLSSCVVHNCLPRDGKALNYHAYSVGVASKFTHAIDIENNRHSDYLVEYYIRQNPDNKVPFSFSYLSYKPGVDILTCSFQLKVCMALLRRGYRVYVPESAKEINTPEEFKDYVYNEKVFFGENQEAYKIN